MASSDDEIWQIEEIGKVRDDGFFGSNQYKAVYVGSYFLVDPYRSRSQVMTKGWLIHEERTELDI